MPRLFRTFRITHGRRSARRNLGTSWFWLQIGLGSLLVAGMIGVTALVTDQAVQQSARPIDVTARTSLPPTIQAATGTTQPAVKAKPIAASTTAKQPVATQPSPAAAEPQHPATKFKHSTKPAPCDPVRQKLAFSNYNQALTSENQRHAELVKKLVSTKGILRFIFPENNDAQIDLENDRHNGLLKDIMSDLRSDLNDAHCNI